MKKHWKLLTKAQYANDLSGKDAGKKKVSCEKGKENISAKVKKRKAIIGKKENLYKEFFCSLKI